MNKFSILKSGLLLAVSSAAIATGVKAQDANDDNALELEEIIVTAGRREQSLQDVPASVTAITPEDFTLKGLQRMQDVISYTPGIHYTDGGNPGTGSISARGVPQSSATPVFGVYLDDTPLTSNTNFSNGAAVFLDALLMDIERVEIIKGPQGTLYGATSVGGMLRYISRDPALEEWRMSAGADISQVDGGSMGKTINGRISAPIIKDRLGITVSGYYQDVPGFVDYVDGANGNVLEKNADEGNVEGFAADLMFTPTDALEVRLKYLKQTSKNNLPTTVNLVSSDSDEVLWGDYTSVNAPGPRALQFEVMSGTLNYDFEWATLTSTTSKTEYEITAFTDFTAAYSGFADVLSGSAPGTTTAVGFDAASGAEKTIQEVRLTSADSEKLEWIAGFYYTNEETHNFQDLNATPAFNLLYANFPSEYTEYAGFGDVTYYFNDKFDLTGGIRVSKNEIVLNLVTSGPLVGPTDFTSETIEDTVETFLFAGRYRMNENTSLYARVASGFRPAQPNIPVIDPSSGIDIAPTIVFSDKAWSYEVGLKGATESGSLNYELALWKIDWSNYQARVRVNGVGTGANAASGLSAYGLDGTASWRANDALTFTANVGYSKSTLNEDEPGFGGVKGEDYPKLPKFKGSLQWDYAFDVTGDWSGNFGGGLRHIGNSMSTFGASVSDVPVKIDARTLMDMNLSVSNGSVSLGIYATNLFNEKTLTDRADNVIGGGVDSNGEFERPRTIGANLRFDF